MSTPFLCKLVSTLRCGQPFHPRVAAAIALPLLLLSSAARGQQQATLDHEIYPPPTGKQAGVLQGSAVAFAGANGFYRLTGCPADAVGGGNAGSVKIYDSNANFLGQLQRPDVAVNDRFGERLAASGSLVAVGAPGKAVNNMSGVGKVYVYDVTSPSAPLLVLSPPTAVANLKFGDSIAISGNILVVGLPLSAPGNVFNAGSVQVYDITNRAAPVLLHTLVKGDATTGEKFGFSVAADGRKIVVGAPHVSSRIGSAVQANVGKAFVYNLDSGTPAQPFLTLANANVNPSLVANDLYGYSTGISGNRVVIGSIYGGNNTGAVYIYRLDSGNPTLAEVLVDPKAPASSVAGDFGACVAISGNYLAVSATAEYKAGKPNCGAVFTYTIGTTTTSGGTAFENPAAVPQGGKLGTSLAVFSSTVLAGVPWDDTEATDAGLAYQFGIGGTSASRIFKAVSPTGSSQFGKSVATAGDVIAIGSPGDPTAGDLAGSVRVFSRSGTTASWTIYPPSGDLPAVRFFGDSVAMAGNRIAVSASYTVSGYSVGRIYVYNTTSNKINPLYVLNNPQPSTMGSFGGTLAMSSGGNRVLAGVHYPNGNTGGAVVYDLPTSATTPWATLVNPTPAAGDLFAQSVAMDGDTVVIGSVGVGQGAIHVYNMGLPSASRPFITASYTNPAPAGNSRFGGGLALKGTRLAVGGSALSGSALSGRVYIMDLGGVSPGTPLLTIMNPGTGTSFGSPLALSGDLLAVGGPTNSTDAIGAGRGYLYSLASSSPTMPVRMLKNPSPQEQDGFTNALALEGNLLVAGAHRDRTIADSAGASYVYYLTDSLNVASDPPSGGSVAGGGTYTIGSARDLTANAAIGWSFKGWSDGVIEATRTVSTPGDGTVFTAIFRPAGYVAWRNYHFTTQQSGDDAISGPNATPLNDGVPNLVKFFLNLSPVAPMSAADRESLPLPQLERIAGVSYFTITYRRNGFATGLSSRLQQLDGDTSGSWSDLTPDLNNTTTDPVTGDQTVTLKIALNGREKLLVRLVVTATGN